MPLGLCPLRHNNSGLDSTLFAPIVHLLHPMISPLAYSYSWCHLLPMLYGNCALIRYTLLIMPIYYCSWNFTNYSQYTTNWYRWVSKLLQDYHFTKFAHIDTFTCTTVCLIRGSCHAACSSNYMHVCNSAARFKLLICYTACVYMSQRFWCCCFNTLDMGNHYNSSKVDTRFFSFTRVYFPLSPSICCQDCLNVWVGYLVG